MSLVVLSHPTCVAHETGPGHPERPSRIRAVQEALESAPFAAELSWREAPRADRAAIERVHEAGYVAGVFATAPERGLIHLDPDTPMGPHSLEAALRAAGAAVHAVDLVMGGEVKSVFCNVRPPGHHAERAKAMGFCFFNNVAVAAAHALSAHGLERVAIVDFDVHHGNGTEDIFRDEPRVLCCSSFQYPLFPDSGADTLSLHLLNVPLPSGTAGPAFREAVRGRWFHSLDNFSPQLMFFSAGFDAHAEDPLAGMELWEDDFRWITDEVKQIADRHAEGRIVSLLEGGYALRALGRSAVAHVGALLGR